MEQPIGTCDLCGGAVTITSPWFGIFPPTPKCNRCGATPEESHGPKIKMKPNPHPNYTATWSVEMLNPDKKGGGNG